MSQIKRACLISIASVTVLINTACVSNRVEWDGNRPGAIKEFISKNENTRTKIWFKEPNSAVNDILVKALGIEKESEHSNLIGRYLSGMKLNSDMTTSFNSQGAFESIASDGTYDLNVLLSYGLSDDLQIAGVHAAISVSSFSSDGELARCNDEFEVVAPTRISKTEKPLYGRDTRLVNNYFFLRKLFVSLARETALLAHRLYRTSASMEPAAVVDDIDLVTYDGRLIKGLVGAVFSKKVVAYRDTNVGSSGCRNAHFVSFSQRYREALSEFAREEDRVRNRKASKNKFKSQQRFRNQQLLYKRLNDRLLGH